MEVDPLDEPVLLPDGGLTAVGAALATGDAGTGAEATADDAAGDAGLEGPPTGETTIGDAAGELAVGAAELAMIVYVPGFALEAGAEDATGATPFA